MQALAQKLQDLPGMENNPEWLELRERLNQLEKESLGSLPLIATETFRPAEFYKQLIDLSDSLLMVFDRNGTLSFLSNALEVFTGYSLNKYRGINVYDLPFLSAAAQTAFRSLLNRIDDNPFPVEQEMDLDLGQDNNFTLKWKFQVILREGIPWGLVGSAINVTEQRKTEESLLRLSQAVEQSANTVIITDTSGLIIYANPRFYEQTGYTANEVEGKTPRFLRAENTGINYKEMWQIIASGNIWRGEFLNRNKDGLLYWERATISPVKNNEGKIISYLAVKEDITAEKAAQEELLQARNFYLSLLEDFPVMVWRSDPKGKLDFVNNTWLDFTGGSKEDELGSGYLKNLHPLDRAVFKDAFQDALRHRKAFVTEFRVLDRYENYRWVLSQGSPFSGPDGKYAGFMAACIDIHDRKNAEKRLMESEDKYRRMFEHSSLGIFRMDSTFSFTSANMAFARMFGYGSPVDVLIDFNHRPQDFYADYAQEVHFRQHLFKSHNEQFVVEREFRRQDKRVLYTLIRLRKEIFGQQKHDFFIEGFIEDITQRKLVERQVKHSEQKFRSLFDKSYDAILIVDELLIVDCNQKAAEVFGISPNLLPGKTVSQLSPEKQDNGMSSRLAALERIHTALGGEPQTFEWKHLRNYEVFDAEVSLARIIVDDKPMLQAIVRDISLRKRAEAELRQSKEEAERARNAQAEFLSQMSHEIRTPLNAVVALTDIVLQDELQPDHRENLSSVKISARHLLGLIDDILDYTKIETGNILFECIPFRVQNLLKDLEKTLGVKAREKGLKLSLSKKTQVPEVVMGDPLRLRQVLINLLSNAIKFTDHGMVSLEVSLVTLQAEQAVVQFHVEDTGIGISADRLEAIFDKFTQAESSTTRRYGGSGLGLAICRKIVELQGGMIEVKSTPGQGSAFFFELIMPLASSQEQAEPVVAKEKGPKDLLRMSILLVEDDAMNQFVARKILEKKWNANLTIVDNGHAALQALEESDFDLVLMDLQMAGLDGYDTTRLIRDPQQRVVRNPQIPIIALTADAFVETRNRAFDAGVDDFITKPFDYELLYQKIAAHQKK